jgi:hypothetical protein
MSKTRLIAAFAAIAAVGGAAVAAEAAATTPPPAPIATPSTHAFSTAQRDQLAFEAGISPKQAEGLTISQLSWLKERRDSDDGAYSVAPAKVDPAGVHS